LATQPSVIKAKQSLDRALEEFASQHGGTKWFVHVNEWGHVEAVIGSDCFEGINVVNRFEAVWDFLRERLSADDLAQVSRIYAWTQTEYAQNVIQMKEPDATDRT